MLNIVHIHLNDVSDQVTVAVDYIPEGQNLSDFNKFDVDVTGQPLRYKILVRSMKIFSILYNTGKGIEEVPF